MVLTQIGSSTIMNISLTSELEQFVQSTVKSGRYSSASEVVRAALRLLEEREMERLVRLEELRKEIMMGIEASDRGEFFDGEEVLRELREEIQQADEDKYVIFYRVINNGIQIERVLSGYRDFEDVFLENRES